MEEHGELIGYEAAGPCHHRGVRGHTRSRAEAPGALWLPRTAELDILGLAAASVFWGLQFWLLKGVPYWALTSLLRSGFLFFKVVDETASKVIWVSDNKAQMGLHRSCKSLPGVTCWTRSHVLGSNVLFTGMLELRLCGICPCSNLPGTQSTAWDLDFPWTKTGDELHHRGFAKQHLEAPGYPGTWCFLLCCSAIPPQTAACGVKMEGDSGKWCTWVYWDGSPKIMVTYI